MTHFEKLNSILHVLLATESNLFAGKRLHGVLTLEFICYKVAQASDEKEVQFLSKRLLSDEYVQIDLVDNWQKPSLTPSGIKFIQAGGYVREQKERELDLQLRQQNLESQKRSKSALVISIVAIVVPSVISIGAILMTSAGPTKEEVYELRATVEKLTDQHYQQQRVLDSLRIVTTSTTNTKAEPNK